MAQGIRLTARQALGSPRGSLAKWPFALLVRHAHASKASSRSSRSSTAARRGQCSRHRRKHIILSCAVQGGHKGALPQGHTGTLSQRQRRTAVPRNAWETCPEGRTGPLPRKARRAPISKHTVSCWCASCLDGVSVISVGSGSESAVSCCETSTMELFNFLRSFLQWQQGRLRREVAGQSSEDSYGPPCSVLGYCQSLP